MLMRTHWYYAGENPTQIQFFFANYVEAQVNRVAQILTNAPFNATSIMHLIQLALCRSLCQISTQ